MAFLPVRFDSGKRKDLQAAASVTFAKGDAVVDNGSGYITTAASSTAVDVHWVAMEAKVTGSAAGEFVNCVSTDGVEFIADTDANPAQTDVGTYADLATKATVNPDASTNDIFFIEEIVGAVGDKKVRGRFAKGVPNS